MGFIPWLALSISPKNVCGRSICEVRYVSPPTLSRYRSTRWLVNTIMIATLASIEEKAWSPCCPGCETLPLAWISCSGVPCVRSGKWMTAFVSATEERGTGGEKQTSMYRLFVTEWRGERQTRNARRQARQKVKDTTLACRLLAVCQR